MRVKSCRQSMVILRRRRRQSMCGRNKKSYVHLPLDFSGFRILNPPILLIAWSRTFLLSVGSVTRDLPSTLMLTKSTAFFIGSEVSRQTMT